MSWLPEELTEPQWVGFQRDWADPLVSKRAMVARYGVGEKRLATIARKGGLAPKPTTILGRVWHEEEDAHLTAAWADRSVTLQMLGLHFGCSETRVKDRANALGLGPRAGVDRSEVKAAIIGLWTAGRSATEIADELGGMTRNAVIGVIHRAGLRRETADRVARKTSTPRQPRAAKHNNPLGGKLQRMARDAKAPPAPPPAAEPVKLTEIPATAKPWTERAFGECAFPMAGSGADLIACCGPGYPYCAAHRKVMYVPPKANARDMKWRLHGVAA